MNCRYMTNILSVHLLQFYSDPLPPTPSHPLPLSNVWLRYCPFMRFSDKYIIFGQPVRYIGNVRVKFLFDGEWILIRNVQNCVVCIVNYTGML